MLSYVLPALGGYAILSIFFLRRPRLLHTPRAPAFRLRLGAHRGGSGERLENTMEALENSVAQRSDLLELDCQLTRDGVVVVSHDENLCRQSGLNRDVSSLDFQDLPLYKEELVVYFSPGHFAHGKDRRMVSLEDVFQRFPKTPVADLVRHFARNEITVWASEKNSVMKKCKAANPDMPRSFTISRGFWVLLLYYLGLLPFIPISERFLLCFLPTIINRYQRGGKTPENHPPHFKPHCPGSPVAEELGHFAHGKDRRMVSLEDVFQRFPKTPVSVEIKEENEELIHKVADLVRHFARNEITVWASEKNSVMKKCKAANPDMPRSFTISRGFWVLLLYYLGLLPFIPISERFLLCFLPTIINRTYFPFSCSWLNQLAAVVSKWVIMRKSLIRHLEERGVQVVFWCLNEESDFEVAFNLGATGVLTDYPTALRRYLDNHGPTALGSLCSPWAAPRVGPLPPAPAMVRISKPKTFQAYLDDCHRRVNVGCGPAEERVLLTGLHAVADIHCENCKTTLGWKYEQAFESSQKYKEGKYIIELNHMIKDNGWD
ncbi:Glycerophosphodiester phosphodiesterase domain-containing protein 3 [Tupaia chinensis]|uniref:Lysophospholipase D GDPD3 n=4 Tax=Euarchontoglires TaxID=314146 RepID=L9KYY9_TUPCH|nr:Glycerophosphodiester phosphodiesterase domain-containing protein 3 [Tupaia chinensis]